MGLELELDPEGEGERLYMRLYTYVCIHTYEVRERQKKWDADEIVSRLALSLISRQDNTGCSSLFGNTQTSFYNRLEWRQLPDARALAYYNRLAKNRWIESSL